MVLSFARQKLAWQVNFQQPQLALLCVNLLRLHLRYDLIVGYRSFVLQTLSRRSRSFPNFPHILDKATNMSQEIHLSQNSRRNFCGQPTPHNSRK